MNYYSAELINETTVVFDTRLKLAVLKLHEENPDKCMDKIKTPFYKNIISGQATIRAWFIKNQDMFSISRPLCLSGRNMPNFYALLCLNVCDMATCHSWDDVTSEILNFNNILFCDFTVEDISSNCACGHKVSPNSTFMIKNETTQGHLLLGCNCGEKFGIISKTEFDKLKKPEIYETLLLNRKLKNQEIAKNKNKSKQIANKWGELAKRITHSVETYRFCIGCGVRCILHIEGSWKIRCKPCYVKHFYPKNKGPKTCRL
jgi:hypothetical protein